MRYNELSKEDRKKYGNDLLDIIELRRKNDLGADNIDDYMLVSSSTGQKYWIYYPED